jgi:ubiquinone biosynthesis UbiH/UbiF/VisC/COQ6 family hydroxylase
MTTLRAEVAIVGGGIVGATLALLLAQRARIDATRIVVIEPAPVAPPSAGSPFGLRVSAISPGNRALLAELGVWPLLDAGRIANYERMLVWHESVPPDSPDVLCFDAAEAGEADLGSIVENNALQAQLLRRCGEQGIRVLGETLRALQVDADAARLDLGGTQLVAELVVGADGAASAVRALLGMPAENRDYGQRAIVATIRGERPHQYTAWQRFLSTGPLALLPLPGNECSIVWSAVNARADGLLALSPAQFETELTAASAGVLGKLQLTSERAAFPLRRLAAQEYVRPRAVLVGDAAHVIHPLAGQGVNQGLEDVVALAAALAQRPARESAGAQMALQRYARERRTGNALAAATVDALDLLFTDSTALRTWAAREGMALVGRSALARRFLVRRAAAGRSWPQR